MNTSPNSIATISALRETIRLRMRQNRDRRRQPIPEGAMRTAQVARLCNLSLRQLQWWDEKNVVKPATVGHSRCYTADDVRAIRTLAELRRKGCSLQVCRRGLRMLKLAGTGDIIATDGKGWYVLESEPIAARFAISARGPVLMVRVPEAPR